MNQTKEPTMTVITRNARLVSKRTLDTPLVLEGSWGARGLGTHKSTMEFYTFDDKGDTRRGFIEWDLPHLDVCEEIGLIWDADGVLQDYDGVMSLPKEAIEMLREARFNVPEDFE